MKLNSIPQIYRHLGRWYEILSVLSKYELAAWVGRLGPDFAKDLLKARGGAPIARHPWETRLRLALAELGPTFIKLGQILSTRPDLVGVRLAEEFRNLQENVPADPPDVIRKLIESELGGALETLRPDANYGAAPEDAVTAWQVAGAGRSDFGVGERSVAELRCLRVEEASFSHGRIFSRSLDTTCHRHDKHVRVHHPRHFRMAGAHAGC